MDKADALAAQIAQQPKAAKEQIENAVVAILEKADLQAGRESVIAKSGALLVKANRAARGSG